MSPGERASNNWFMHRAVRYRFVGIDPEQCRDMHASVVAIAEQFTGSNAELVAALDAEAERHYPEAYATAWMASADRRKAAA